MYILSIRPPAYLIKLLFPLFFIFAFPLAPTVRAAILFSDNFNTSTASSDVNFEYDRGRQSGTLGNLQYLQGNNAFRSTVVGAVSDEAIDPSLSNIGGLTSGLRLSGSPSSNVGTVIASVSPMHNFTENPGIGNYMSISFSIDPITGVNGTSTEWGAILFGSGDNASFGNSGTGARGQFITNPVPGWGILFRDNGLYQVFDGGSNIVNDFIYSATPNTVTTHLIEIRISGLIDGNPWDGVNNANVELWANGVLINSITKSNGFASNFITLQSLATVGASQFDNFQVAIAPEPSISGLLIVGGMTMLFIRRRRA